MTTFRISTVACSEIRNGPIFVSQKRVIFTYLQCMHASAGQYGSEIPKEILKCENCYANMRSNSDVWKIVKQNFLKVSCSISSNIFGVSLPYLPWALREPIYPRRGPYGPLPKIPGKCPLGINVGRVSQGGLNITFTPKKSQPSTFGCHKGIMKIAA